jgi:hypothetical protein
MPQVDDDVPGDVLELLREDDLELMTQLISSIYETGKWPKNVIQVTMIVLRKKSKATICSDHHTVSLITHRAKLAVRIFRRRMENKMEDVLGKDRFGFRRGKGTKDAVGMLRIISE